MRNIFLILIVFLLPTFGFSQTCLDVQSSGSVYTLKVEKGALKGVLGLGTTPYKDTLQTYSSGVACYPGLMVVVGNELWLRDTTATKWNKVGVVGNFVLDVFRKHATDSVFVELYNGETKFAYIDSTGGGGETIDTTSLSQRIDQRVKYSELDSILAPLRQAYYNIAEMGDSGVVFIRINEDSPADSLVFRITGGGGGGGNIDTTTIYLEISKRVKYTDMDSLLANYISSADTANKWISDALKINETTLRLYKGSSFIDISLPEEFDSTTVYQELAKRVKYTDVDSLLDNVVKYDDIDSLKDLLKDTVVTKFPIVVDQSGVKDTLKLKYPPNSVAVNLINDTADVQFLTIKRVSNQVSTDTVRWVAATSVPSGTPEIYYSWSQIGKQVTLKIWAYYPTAGAGVSAASIDLPSGCPTPLIPAGWSAESELIVEVGGGGLFVNKTRDITSLANSAAASVLRRNVDNTKWELINKMGSGSYRYSVWNIIYESQ